MAGSCWARKPVGVLALQGNFAAHQEALVRAGASAVQVRTPAELTEVSALIMPGGESTTMLLLLREGGLEEPLREFAASKPVFGTCAGAILLACRVSHPEQPSLALFNIDIERNGYGRQIDSRVASIPAADHHLAGGDLEAVFIRAPIIRNVGPKAAVLATYRETPVLVEQGRHLAATFHPELTNDLRVHQLFLSKIK